MTLENGTRLGHYRVLGLLGRGGMADVYRAEDERLGREVALKLVPPEFTRDPDRVERFEREVRAAAKLTHPNIVVVHEFGQEGGQPFYTMALMRGGDLKARIQAHPEGMPPEEAREVALALARALEYAHDRGFVHRDVKPENILFGEDGAPQLTDFGIARAMSSGTRMTATGMSIGSPHYMSPEQARGQAVDGRSDLYSLGVVLYEMLTGQVPFDAGDTLAVALSHLNDPVPALPGHLAGWQPLLDRLLAKSPGDRYGSARELTEILATDALPPASDTQPGAVSATPLSPATRVISRAHEVGRTAGAREFVSGAAEANPPRRGGLLAVVAGGALALAVVGILYVTSREDPDRLSSGDGGGNAGARAERSGNSSLPVVSDDRNPRNGATETPVSRLAALEEQALGLDRAARAEVQVGLVASGFDPGEPDGAFSSRTRAALREWQAIRGRPTTGYLDAESAAVLRSVAEAEVQRREAAARRGAEGRRQAEALQAELEAAARRDLERPKELATSDLLEDILFSEDFSSGTYANWTTVGKGPDGGSPSPGALSIVRGVLRIDAATGGNYDLRVSRDIRVGQRYRRFNLSFAWKAVMRETPWGLDAVRLVFYDENNRGIGQLVAVNSGQTRRRETPLEASCGDMLSNRRCAGVGRLADTFDWQRVTLDTAMIPGMDPRRAVRLELRAWVYNDAGSGGEMHFDDFDLRATQ